MDSFPVLLGVRGEQGMGPGEFKRVLATLREHFDLGPISSQFLGDHQVRGFRNLLRCISFCVLARPKADEDLDILNVLKGLRELYESAHPHWGEVLVLNWEDRVQLNPELVLPHPEWHRKAYWVLPSAEIVGELVHPVLKRPVREVLAEIGTLSEESKVKFFDRGISLL